jgi:hypothetical protein
VSDNARHGKHRLTTKEEDDAIYLKHRLTTTDPTTWSLTTLQEEEEEDNTGTTGVSEADQRDSNTPLTRRRIQYQENRSVGHRHRLKQQE